MNTLNLTNVEDNNLETNKNPQPVAPLTVDPNTAKAILDAIGAKEFHEAVGDDEDDSVLSTTTCCASGTR